METEQDTTQETREQDTKAYLDEHRILDLFNNLTAQLIFKKPGNADRYIVISKYMNGFRMLFTFSSSLKSIVYRVYYSLELHWTIENCVEP